MSIMLEVNIIGNEEEEQNKIVENNIDDMKENETEKQKKNKADNPTSKTNDNSLLSPYHPCYCGEGFYERIFSFPSLMCKNIGMLVLSPFTCPCKYSAFCMSDFLCRDMLCNPSYAISGNKYDIKFSQNEFKPILKSNYTKQLWEFDIGIFKSRDEELAANAIKFAAIQFTNKKTNIRTIKSFTYNYTPKFMDALVDLIVSLPLVYSISFLNEPRIGNEAFVALIDGVIDKVVPSRLKWMDDNKDEFFKQTKVKMRLDFRFDQFLRVSAQTFAQVCQRLENVKYPIFLSIAGSFTDKRQFDVVLPAIDNLMIKNPYVGIYTDWSSFGARLNDLVPIKLENVAKNNVDAKNKYILPGYTHFSCGEGFLERTIDCAVVSTSPLGILLKFCGFFCCCTYTPCCMTDFIICDKCDPNCCKLDLENLLYSKSEIKYLLHSNFILKSDTLELDWLMKRGKAAGIETSTLIEIAAQEYKDKKTNFTQIRACRGYLDDRSISHLANLIISLPRVTTVIIWDNSITGEGFVEYIDLLLNNVVPSRENIRRSQGLNQAASELETYFCGNHISLKALRVSCSKLELIKYPLKFVMRSIYSNSQEDEFKAITNDITKKNPNVSIVGGQMMRKVLTPIEDMHRW